MNIKAIQFHIEKKVDHWLRHAISNRDKRQIVRKQIIVTGGCITSMLLDEDVNDYDIYFKDFETTAFFARKYVKEFRHNPPERFQDTLNRTLNIHLKADKETGVVILINMEESAAKLFSNDFNEWLERALHSRTPTDELEKYRPLFLTSNAISLSDQVQLIIRFYGGISDVHENFDFQHCKNYWTEETGLMLDKDALASTLTKQLHYTGSLYPVCSIFRARKFINRGWFITAGDLLKMVLQCNQLDLTDKEILRDQLTGVDTTQFSQLIAKLPDQTEITNELLLNLIEEVF